MSSSLTMCDRCRDRKGPDKMIAGAFGYTNLRKRCKYQLQSKETLSEY